MRICTLIKSLFLFHWPFTVISCSSSMYVKHSACVLSYTHMARIATLSDLNRNLKMYLVCLLGFYMGSESSHTIHNNFYSTIHILNTSSHNLSLEVIILTDGFVYMCAVILRSYRKIMRQQLKCRLYQVHSVSFQSVSFLAVQHTQSIKDH